MRRLCPPLSWLRLAPALLTLAIAPALAQSAASAFSLHETSAPSASPWTLSVTGQWPTQCPPTLQAVHLDGNDLRIDARSNLDLCARGTTPFSIELNPALAMQRTDLAPGVYHVSFYAAEGAQARPRLRAFALVDRSAPDAPTIVPETGFWWSTGADRSLLSLDLQDGQLSTALLTYDAAGQASWLFGTAAFDGRIAQIPLLHLSGGSDPFAAPTDAPQGSAAMTLNLQFSSAGRAQAWLTRAQGGDGSLQLQAMQFARLPLAESADGSAWRGDWILAGGASDAAPLRLSFENFKALDAQHFELADRSGATVLSCTRAPAPADWPPAHCDLRVSGTAFGHFDSVAIARMDGTEASGAVVHLLRVTP